MTIQNTRTAPDSLFLTQRWHLFAHLYWNQSLFSLHSCRFTRIPLEFKLLKHDCRVA